MSLAVADIAVMTAAEVMVREPSIEPNVPPLGIPAASLSGIALRVPISWMYCWSCTGKSLRLAGLRRTMSAESNGRLGNSSFCCYG